MNFRMSLAWKSLKSLKLNMISARVHLRNVLLLILNVDSVRHFLQRNKLGKYAEKPDREDLPKYAEEAAVIQVGERCEVETEEAGMKRRGIVMFVGETKFKYGFWVGVEYDEPLGKHDGLVDGERYFKCRPGHGAFVRPNKVVTGDFPELDPFADSDVDEM